MTYRIWKGRKMGGHVEAIQDLVRRHDAAQWLRFDGAHTVSRVYGSPVSFCVRDQHDIIQRHHHEGRFYEEDVLLALQKRMQAGWVILDIGANIGNHALFWAAHSAPKRIILVEPNLEAVELLLANLFFNNVWGVMDLSRLGWALGARAETGFGLTTFQHNLGAARLAAGDGEISTEQGDVLFGDEPVDLIKIDVEKMEMEVLGGLEGLIAARRPLMLVEVDHDNRAEFETWLAAHDYVELELFESSVENQNLIVAPREKQSGG